MASLLYPDEDNKNSVKLLSDVLNSESLLSNYVAANDDEIIIMTLHKSKGLEFNIVFHMDMYKYIIPIERGSEVDREQDLNLHYVGITRAIDACYIMNGTMRFRNHFKDYIEAKPSPFLYMPGLLERRIELEW